MAPSFKEYDRQFAAWWRQVQRLLKPRFGVDLLPGDSEVYDFDAYGSFDSHETPEQFAEAVVASLKP